MKASPTAGVIDSQSVKTTEAGGPRGFDAGKKVKGRKRHILTDTTGLLVGAIVHEASIQDRDGRFPKVDRRLPANGAAGVMPQRHSWRIKGKLRPVPTPASNSAV